MAFPFAYLLIHRCRSLVCAALFVVPVFPGSSLRTEAASPESPAAAPASPAQATATAADAKVYGPYHGQFRADGISSLRQPVDDKALRKPEATWTIHMWVQPEKSDLAGHKHLLAGFGEASNRKGEQRYLAVFEEGVRFWGGSLDIATKTPLETGAWQFLAATYSSDGIIRIYKDGRQIAAKKAELAEAKTAEIYMAPISPWKDGVHFGGRIADFTLTARAMSESEIELLARKKDVARLDKLEYAKGSLRTWETRGNSSNLGKVNQKLEQLPRSRTDFSRPAQPKPASTLTLVPGKDGALVLAGPWKMIEEPKLPKLPQGQGQAAAQDTGAELSRPDSEGALQTDWLAATVPGTALTTLVDQGVYPDPFYGLNNMAIPETLNKQDYWYRLEFTAPTVAPDRLSSLTFNGVNYAAEVWLNGKRLGKIKGAFIRGTFDVTGTLKPGEKNALAVRVSPAPNPGTPHEQSPRAGAGPNGGAMCLDGPTFFCSEGWDWIPGIRDRNTGIWQDVILRTSGPVTIGDPHVITRIAQPAGSQADVTIEVDITNSTATAQNGTLHAEFEGVQLQKSVRVEPNSTVSVQFTPVEFPLLAVANPRLWWPNGYGKPELYNLALRYVTGDGKTSDTRSTRFGMREVSVVFTGLNDQEKMTRYEFHPAAARAALVVKNDHASLVSTPQGWMPTVSGDITRLPGIRPSEAVETDRYLEIRVNGVRIPARGGNWGMDDGMKRVSRQRLEPYVRLQRDANFNILRNWCGQSTSQALYELCDEYGIMIWNEFWLTTQGYNAEPRDNDLWLRNAADTIKRFRTHPSIVIWCGRNEGVPPQVLNTGLDKLIRELDGTRYYQPSSITVNLSGSGPWKYIPPEDYFGRKGFTTELGLPSLMTADGMRAIMAPEDLWPAGDAWGYHDWLEKGAMDTKAFMAALTTEYGEPANFEDLVRKAQMMNYVSHRAMFEALNANLWKPSTGTLLWMSHPSWPSTVWQIYGYDYEPNASLYGIKKACEPVHVQMNLPDYAVQVSNTTLQPLTSVRVHARVYDIRNTLIASKEKTLDVPINGTAPAFTLEPATNTAFNLVKLELTDASGKLLSQNLYCRAPKKEDIRGINDLASVRLAADARIRRDAGANSAFITVNLENREKTAALMTFLTLRNAADNSRILPAFASDNYISLLPGEKCTVVIETAASSIPKSTAVTLDGWNVEPQKLTVLP